jgi:hypothetical protein
MWMLEGVSGAMREAGIPTMRDDVAITPAQSASKVVYYCALLRGQKLKHRRGLRSPHPRVAALLDSDAAGDQAATQDEFPSGRSPSRREGNPAVVVGTIAAMATTTDDEPDCRSRFAGGFRGAVQIFIDQR